MAVVSLAASRRGHHVLRVAPVMQATAAVDELARHRRGRRREEQLKGGEGFGQAFRVTGRRRGRCLIHT